MTKNLLNIDANAKTVKGQKKGYMTGVLYLAPAKLSGFEVCPFRSAGCTAACLNTAGRGAFSNVQKARIRKTKEFFADKKLFISDLCKDIVRLIAKASKKGLIPVVRLNGTSDIAWENMAIIDLFKPIQFYDYTKNPIRMKEFLAGKMPANYHLTFSANEANADQVNEILKLGGNVAVVFAVKRGHILPAYHNGFKVLDGDESDLRFLEGKQGAIIGLRAKGKARKGNSKGFVEAPQYNVTEKEAA